MVIDRGFKSFNHIERSYKASKTRLEKVKKLLAHYLYNWKSKYDGLEASDLKRFKELEQENKRLKRMYAELSLEHEAFKDAVAKKL